MEVLYIADGGVGIYWCFGHMELWLLCGIFFFEYAVGLYRLVCTMEILKSNLNRTTRSPFGALIMHRLFKHQPRKANETKSETQTMEV
jgi:hypothetical protein